MKGPSLLTGSNHMRGCRLTALSLVFLAYLTFLSFAHAETKVLTTEATYTMGDGETPSFAEAQVLQRAKQMALEQAGTYVESYTKVQNLSLTLDEIQTITGGILKVEVLEKSRKLVGDGLQIYIKIRATVTTDDIANLAQRIRGKNIAEEYRKLQEEYARLSKEMETWKTLLAKAPPGPERDAAISEIREREKALEGARTKEATFIQNLLSGEALVASAMNQREQVDRLMTTIRDRGQITSIGTVDAVRHETKEKTLVVTVPITLVAASTLSTLLSQAATALGGEVVPELLEDGERSLKYLDVNYATNSGKIRLGNKVKYNRDCSFVEKYCSRESPVPDSFWFAIKTRGTPVHLSRNRRVEEYIRNEVSNLALVVQLQFDGTEAKSIGCRVPPVVNRLIAVRESRSLTDNLISYDLGDAGARFLPDEPSSVLLLTRPIEFQIEFPLINESAKRLSRVQAMWVTSEDAPQDICLTTIGKD